MEKIVFVTQNMHGGGCERVIAELANWFTKQEIKVLIITECKSESFYDLADEVELINLGNQRKIKSKNLFSIYYKLRKLLINIQPDVVISMPEKVNVWTVLAMIGTNIPVVVSERNDPNKNPKSKIKRIIRKICYPLFADGFVFQTIEAKKYFSDYVQSKGTIIANPLNLKKLPEPFKGNRKKEIVSIGRLDYQKNFILLIDAFAEFLIVKPGYKLIIFGEGPLKDDLTNYASQKLDINSFEFAGKREDVLAKIRESAIYVLSSDYEGMPNALIEALSLGIPCISTDCEIGGPRALIKNNENGILIDVNSKVQLVKSMVQLENDKLFSREMGLKAISIRDELNVDIIGDKWKEYLSKFR